MAVTKVASAASSTLLHPGNAGGTGFIVENSDANRLHVLLGAGVASAADKSFSLAQHEAYEIRSYSGPLTGIWEGDGAGYAHVTEL